MSAIADLFCKHFTHVRGNAGRVSDALREENPRLRARDPALAVAIQAADGAIPPGAPDWFTTSRAHPLDAFAAAQTIDLAFEGFLDGEQMPGVRDALRRTGRLNRDEPGCLLPVRWRYIPQGAEVERHFTALSYEEPRGDLGFEWSEVSPFSVAFGGARVKVAFLPLIGAEDVEFKHRATREDIQGAPAVVFDVEIRDESALIDRFVRAIRDAERLGCEILVAPELSVTPVVRDAVLEALGGRLEGSTLQLVLLGTCAVPTERVTNRNEAVLVSGFGEALLVQNKLHPYTMSVGEQERYGIEDFGKRAAWENLSLGDRKLGLLDIPTLGRLAILICEDLAHEDCGILGCRLGARTLLNPVMDGAFEKHRWVARFANAYQCFSGVRVLSTNGLVLPELQQRASGEPHKGRIAFVSRVSRDTYESKFGVSHSPDRIVVREMDLKW